MFNITARELQDTNITRKILKDELKRVLLSVKESILNVHKQGIENINIKLPITFPNIPLDNEYSKIYIYSNIIEKLKEKNFRVKIRQTSTKTILNIKWNVVSEDLEWKRMQAVITDHS